MHRIFWDSMVIPQGFQARKSPPPDRFRGGNFTVARDCTQHKRKCDQHCQSECLVVHLLPPFGQSNVSDPSILHLRFAWGQVFRAFGSPEVVLKSIFRSKSDIVVTFFIKTSVCVTKNYPVFSNGPPQNREWKPLLFRIRYYVGLWKHKDKLCDIPVHVRPLRKGREGLQVLHHVRERPRLAAWGP